MMKRWWKQLVLRAEVPGSGFMLTGRTGKGLMLQKFLGQFLIRFWSVCAQNWRQLYKRLQSFCGVWWLCLSLRVKSYCWLIIVSDFCRYRAFIPHCGLASVESAEILLSVCGSSLNWRRGYTAVFQAQQIYLEAVKYIPWKFNSINLALYSLCQWW